MSIWLYLFTFWFSGWSLELLLLIFLIMDRDFCDNVKKGLRCIDGLDELERERFVRNVMNREFSGKKETPGISIFPMFILNSRLFLSGSDTTESQYIQVQNAIISLFTIATKHLSTREELREFLTTLGIQEPSIECLLENYNHVKDDIRTKLSRYGHDIPMTNNVNWKLSSVLRSSGKEDLNSDLIYKVTFEECDASGITTIDCTFEELQHLTSKFKEIERNCLKLGENKL